MSVKYSYHVIDDFLNSTVNIERLSDEIQADSSLYVSLDYINVVDIVCDIWFKTELDLNMINTLSGIVSSHSGIKYEYTNNVHIIDEWRDKSGKLRIHQTSRKLGLRTHWTGEGDDVSDPHSIGGGEKLFFTHSIGEVEPDIKYLDFNIVNNETHLHEGYLTWKGCLGDTISLSICTRHPDYIYDPTFSSNYNLYGGYLIVPTTPGTGNINITSDLTTHSGGLIYMPDDDLGNYPVAAWDADWNITTKRYDNIRPNITNTGRYNIFAGEINFATIINNIPLLDNGFIALGSSDTEELGHGMRIKLTADTNNDVPDHDWMMACIICCHRDKS